MDEGSKAARDFSSRGSRIEGSRAELNQLVRLESDELRKTTEVVSTGLNGEQSRTNAESSMEVLCADNHQLASRH